MEKKKVTIEKLSELDEAIHPNNILEGFTKTGDFISPPKVGENFWVGCSWRTSTVKEIINDTTFKTCNSIYKITVFELPKPFLNKSFAAALRLESELSP